MASDSLSGAVRADELLTLGELRRRLHWEDHAVRQARRAGLRLVEFGRQKYVRGSDLMAFFADLAAQQSAASSGGTVHITEGARHD